MQYIVVILTFPQHLFLKIAATLEESNLRIMSNYKYYTTVLSKVSFDNELFSKEYELNDIKSDIKIEIDILKMFIKRINKKN